MPVFFRCIALLKAAFIGHRRAWLRPERLRAPRGGLHAGLVLPGRDAQQ